MKGATPAITIVGSFMMDLVVRTTRRPSPGETVFGTEFGMFPGGKGFNQAIASARLGARTAMVGRIGRDYFGDEFLNTLRTDGVDASQITRDLALGTGVGLPVIGADGDNAIIVVPRANMALTTADVEAATPLIEAADVLLLQLEVPQEANIRAAEIARQADTLVVLNPAPATTVQPELLALADVLVPNEWETRAITGIMPSSEPACAEAANRLFALGAKQVVLTLGSQGAYVAVSTGERRLIPAFRVGVVDTTGAGDAFCGGLAFSLARGMGLMESALFAMRVGALAVTVMGSSSAMPRLAAVEAFVS